MRLTSIATLLIFLSGCSLINPGNGQQPPSEWEKMAPVIQQRVKYVTMFAFSVESVKPYKAQVCNAAQNIATLLESYDDHDATFENVHNKVLELISKIEDDNVRSAVTIVMEIALTEAFNYGWEHYQDLINQDSVKSTIIIAKAVAHGVTDACSLTVSSFDLHDPKPMNTELFTTVRGKEATRSSASVEELPCTP